MVFDVVQVWRGHRLLVGLGVADLAAEVAHTHSAQRNNRSVDEDDPREKGGLCVVAQQEYKANQGDGCERPNSDHKAFGGFLVGVNKVVRKSPQGLERLFSLFAGGSGSECGEDSTKNGSVAQDLGGAGLPKGSNFEAKRPKEQCRDGHVHQNDVEVDRIHT